MTTYSKNISKRERKHKSIIKMISTLYVVFRVDHHLMITNKERNVGIEALAYTACMDDGCRFIETVAARDVHGRDWSNSAYGDPFYDPLNDEKLPPPPGKFVVWDCDLEEDDTVLDRVTSLVCSVSVFSEEPDRVLLRSYKLCRVNPMVSDFVKATTEGDLEMQRQMITGNI